MVNLAVALDILKHDIIEILLKVALNTIKPIHLFAKICFIRTTNELIAG
jgi:hypothetical protein